MAKTLEEQLKSAKRELAMRRNAYARWVLDKRMTLAQADHEIACMEGIVETLSNLLASKGEN